MSALHMFLETPLAEAAGWAVIHSLWEGTLAAAMLGAALLVLRSPRFRYAAACLAIFMSIAAFAFTLVYMIPDGAQQVQPFRPPAFAAWNMRPVASLDSRWDMSLAWIAPWLAPFWFAGVLIFYLRHAAGLLAVRRLRRRGVCSPPERWRREVARLSSRLHLSRPISLLESCLVDVPMVVGHWRPLILMPIGVLTGLPAEQVEAILLHELAHIRRHDYLVNTMQRLVEGLLFYHPAVWWISRVMSTERENCCDDIVVSIRGNAHEYAVALTALEENRCSGRERAVAATGGNLMKRIRRLLYPAGPNGIWTPVLATGILIATATVALGAWHSELRRSPAPQEQTDHADKYSKWLNEDVVYIIDDAERAAFEKLTTDEERDQFIEQFWARRDPTPGTPENEFKDEHYRRIGYANQHFGTAGSKGWQTDRGHMYIVYGPPDEIDAHPKGTQGPYAIQMWMYRHVEGLADNSVLTFIDKTGQGDYRLAPGNAR